VNHVFVQPHFDDVALGCGGTVASLAAAGEGVWLVTVFSDGPRGPTRGSPLARQLHAHWRTGRRAARVRAAEDDEAARYLGAVPLRLGLREAVYRGHRYRSWDQLYGTPHRRDQQLAERVASILGSFPVPAPQELYVPLALSGHVDHRIVREAGELLADRGARISYYEDFGEGPVRTAGMDPREGLVPMVVDTTAFVDRKVLAVRAYESQIGGLFGADDAASLGAPGQPASEMLRCGSERLWNRA
jgi:LmbE family N-acetylglucosaminyl deacetylase